MFEVDIAHRLTRYLLGAVSRIMVRDQHRLEVGRHINSIVRTTDEVRIKGYHIHQRTEAQSLAEQLPRDAQPRQAQVRINEQLTRVIAGLAMNIDRPREIRSAGIIEPIVVTEPSP